MYLKTSLLLEYGRRISLSISTFFLLFVFHLQQRHYILKTYSGTCRQYKIHHIITTITFFFYFCLFLLFSKYLKIDRVFVCLFVFFIFLLLSHLLLCLLFPFLLLVLFLLHLFLFSFYF